MLSSGSHALPANPCSHPLMLCCLPILPWPQLNLDPQQVVMALPSHVMACLLGYLSGVLKSGKQWSADLTDCTLTDSGPLEHVVRGASVLVTFLELIPRFRCGYDHCTVFGCPAGVKHELNTPLADRLNHASVPGTSSCLYGAHPCVCSAHAHVRRIQQCHCCHRPCDFVCRSIYTSVLSDMSFTSCVLDLSHGMLMAAAGPLWQQFQRTDLRPAER